MENENSKIEIISGVGPKKAELLRSVGINTLGELLSYFPSRYDYYKFTDDIRKADDGTKCLFYLTYNGTAKRKFTEKTGYFTMWNAHVGDVAISFVWFNQQFILKMLETGKRYLVKCTLQRRGNSFSSVNPHFILKDGISRSLLEPVYRAVPGISSKQIQSMAMKALELTKDSLSDAVPAQIRAKYGIVSLADAYRKIHSPENEEECLSGMRRFIFEEFFTFRMHQLAEKSRRATKGAELVFEEEAVSELEKRLPFRLTQAQMKAVNDVMHDMRSPVPMNRIIQGDVGSGKTVVAFAACLMAMCAGRQSIIMVPTEVLARQHKDSFDKLFHGFGINAGLLVGSLKAKEKQEIKERFSSGDIGVLIGTHAVIEDDVQSGNVGLVVTDEQHRFGVKQRFRLKSKGKPVNMLVMTATPIPRTLSMTVFGDLDVSVIDELPPDRIPIKTYAVNSTMRKRIHTFIAKEVSEGRQAYIICPSVEESDEARASVKEYLSEMAENGLKSVRCATLYGSMKPDEKDSVMTSFANGEIDVLVSTTVIEVGINVPNATVIVIENAERFGLAQLHQLRGRVGRGKAQSHCILISDTVDENAIERLKTLVKTTDGFEIAKEDMRLRGAGEYFGQRQSGMKQFAFGELPRDLELFEKAADAVSFVMSNKESYADFFETMQKKAEELDKKIVFN